MKKLLTCAALLAVCAPAFTAEVESSNTVGYTKINLSTGYTTLAPAFFSVGQDTTELTAMEVVDGIDGDNLSLLNSSANVVEQYYWFNEFVDGADVWPAMWAADSQGAEEATDVSFDQMEGFLFYSNSIEGKFKHWGEVLENDVEGVALNTGYTTLGNPYNKELPLENLVPVNAVDGDFISLLNSTANVVEQYYWFNEFVDGADVWPAMWAADSQGAEEAEGVTLDPNEAFLLYSNGTAATLNVTAP